MASIPQPQPRTAEDIRDLLARLLAVAGGTPTRWKRLIHKVEPATSGSGWHVAPRGTAAQREAIRRTVETVRADHPHLRDSTARG